MYFSILFYTRKFSFLISAKPAVFCASKMATVYTQSWQDSLNSVQNSLLSPTASTVHTHLTANNSIVYPHFPGNALRQRELGMPSRVVFLERSCADYRIAKHYDTDQ